MIQKLINKIIIKSTDPLLVATGVPATDFIAQGSKTGYCSGQLNIFGYQN